MTIEGWDIAQALKQAKCGRLRTDEQNLVVAEIEAGVRTVKNSREILEVRDVDTIIHYDLFRTVTGLAAVLGNIARGIEDLKFSSWALAISGLAQLRGIREVVPASSAALCMILFEKRTRKEEDLRRDFDEYRRAYLDDEAADFPEALGTLEDLGCVRRDDGSVRLTETVVLRLGS